MLPGGNIGEAAECARQSLKVSLRSQAYGRRDQLEFAAPGGTLQSAVAAGEKGIYRRECTGRRRLDTQLPDTPSYIPYPRSVRR